MQHPRSNQLDYVDDDATVIDAGPHWSMARVSRAHLSLVPPSPPSPLPPPRPRPLQISAVAPRVPLPPPLRAPVAFYSYAEEAARQHLDTERVAPLPMSELESPWLGWLATAWQRFAAPACGLIAGLILVVGYLASSSQGAAIATTAAPSTAIRLPTELALQAPEPIEPVLAEPPPAAEVEPTLVAEPAAALAAHVPVKRSAPKKRVSTASRAKRGPIRIDASTPLGNLRPSRSF